MAAPTVTLDFQIDSAFWRRIPRLRAHMRRAAQMTAAHLPKKFRFPFTATVLLTGNAKIRQLNHDFRGMDKPTNILSFPQFPPTELPKLGKAKEPVELGDMALGYQYIAAEAKKDHKILINHISHLVIHGLLHLFGYDHLIDRDAEAMEKLETEIMKALGLPDPYAMPPNVSQKKTTTEKRRRHDA